jgi:hypothetical protein
MPDSAHCKCAECLRRFVEVCHCFSLCLLCPLLLPSLQEGCRYFSTRSRLPQKWTALSTGPMLLIPLPCGRWAAILPAACYAAGALTAQAHSKARQILLRVARRAFYCTVSLLRSIQRSKSLRAKNFLPPRPARINGRPSDTQRRKTPGCTPTSAAAPGVSSNKVSDLLIGAGNRAPLSQWAVCRKVATQGAKAATYRAFPTGRVLKLL